MVRSMRRGLASTISSVLINEISANMKSVIIIVCTLLLLLACNQIDIKASKSKIDKQGKVEAGRYLDSAKLAQFINEHKMNDSAARLLRSFYKSRNYQFAWFTETGIAESTREFWTLHNNYIHNFGDTAFLFDALHQSIDQLLTTDSTTKILPQLRLQTELQLTTHFFVYLNNAYAGKASPAVMQWHIPRKKLAEVALLNSFLARNGSDLQDWEPVNMFYKRLKEELLHYNEIEKRGGWKIIALNKLKTYKLGDSSTLIAQFKRRIHFTVMAREVDTNSYYSSELLPLVKSAQKSFGLKEDGIITAALIKELNVPVKERIRQILTNMERMRWLPYQPDSEFIGVNIPEFRLHLFEGEKKLFSIDIVVGKAAHNTVIFADKLQYVVFSPYWNVPPSIVRKEILPAIKRNGSYLSKNNMERTGYADGLPVIRQKPGGENALGRVKFIFPNSYNIYFHDTPAKSLFSEDSRAFSHGCMRLADPVKLVTHLLRQQPEWITQKIANAMDVSVEKWVTLKEEVPVYITYFTAWVDSDGLLNFRKDIYNHDKKVARSLYE
ncbi:MAG: hypothetical protein EOP48_09375 [Sphingobacteriales bacterium]|nr:MAG: hypothetical protein EOP48_09375 [Sphingobacteriales bacterium]